MNKKTIVELFDELKRWNAAYRMGKPEVDDRTYDERFDALKKLDPDNSWFKSLEPAPVKEERKRKLPIPMKSLNKVKSMAELKAWLKATSLSDFKLVIMPKFDGLSLLYNEKTGEAYSRGGAENEGQDCSRHCAMLSDTHNRSENEYLYTFGEFVFSRKNWGLFFEGRKMEWMDEAYKSPRNTAAGLLNRDNPSPEISLVDFYRYGLDDETLFKFYNYFDAALGDICEDFGQKPLYKVIDKTKVNEDILEDLFRKWAAEYYIDGLVIYIDNLNTWQRLGRDTNGNPRYAIAYKHPNFTDNFETTVQDINWKVSKVGALKPTVRIDAVNTGDCIMDNPTGNNHRWLLERKISKGAKVLVTRSGGVIPKILSCITPAPDFDEHDVAPEKCPACGSSLIGRVGDPDIYCTNPKCSGRKLAEIMHFITVCNIEGLGEDTVAKLFNAGYHSLRHFLNADIHWMMKVEGIGASLAEIVYFEFQRVKKDSLPITVLMHASSCFPGIGKVKAEKELDAMSAEEMEWFLKETWSLHQPALYSPEFDKLSATRKILIKGYSRFFNWLKTNGLSYSVPRAIQQTNKAYEGFNVCFSGIRDLKLEERIKAGGGHVGSGVTSKTTHLIVKDPSQETSKTRAAREKSIEILTLQDFIDKY